MDSREDPTKLVASASGGVLFDGISALSQVSIFLIGSAAIESVVGKFVLYL